MLLSIITINKNNKEGLQRTLESIKNQTFKDFEYIVVDGLSDDGSIEIINNYSDSVNQTIIEPDQGIYQAMNKGIRKASGQFLLFLNSGDSLHSKDSLEKLQAYLIAGEADIYYSDALFIKYENQKQYIKHYPEHINPSYFVSKTLCHQTSVIRKELFEHIGSYQENFKISADWAFFIDVAHQKARFKYMSKLILSNFSLGGMSENYRLSKEEHRQYLIEKYPQYLKEYDNKIYRPTIYYRLLSKIRRLLS